MRSPYRFEPIPPSRIATFDTSSLSNLRHHVSALLEFDVTESRKQLKELRRNGVNASFNGWLIKTISSVLYRNREATAFLVNRKKLIIFNDINVSVIIEKKSGETRVPVPVIIERAQEKSSSEITGEIESAKSLEMEDGAIVLNERARFYERLYYILPGFLRRGIWRIMLARPGFLFRKMGNVVITSVGMMGRINGWFIHKTIHPVSFGVGSVLRKPVVIGNEICIREILNMTILVDHDVIDGAPMVRFLNDLTRAIESGIAPEGKSTLKA